VRQRFVDLSAIPARVLCVPDPSSIRIFCQPKTFSIVFATHNFLLDSWIDGASPTVPQAKSRASAMAWFEFLREIQRLRVNCPAKRV
jgi:hypothetical protein